MGDRIEAREFGDSLLRRLRIGGVGMPRLNSCTAEEGREHSLVTRAMRRDLWGGHLEAPFSTDVTLHDFHPSEGQILR